MLLLMIDHAALFLWHLHDWHPQYDGDCTSESTVHALAD
jgi:hypothetical protein